ncbi:MAG: flagellar hook-associated protein FlgL [Firmicutes bacterium]|nr:flagellar hook-associated protein FlgL [Bacillota bacterium]
MRISHNMIAQNMIRAIQTNLEGLTKSQEMMSSGKRINRPSDDPPATNNIISIHTALSINRQYTRNINDGLAWLNQTDAALGDAIELLHKARDFAVQGASGTLTREDMQAIAREVDGIIDGMANVANSNIGGTYIFAGMQNAAPPFDVDKSAETVTFSGNTDAVLREIASDFTVQVDAGGAVFGAAGPGSVTSGVFFTLFRLRDALDAGDNATVSSLIGEIDQRIDEMMVHRVKIGSRTNQLESLKSQLQDQEVRLTGILSYLQDADIARTSIEFGQHKLAYEATLSAGARLLQTSLLDFLK